MNRLKIAVAVLAASAFAAVAFAQNADENTAGPTRNDYRLKVIEPADGASINGPTIRVVVDTTVPEQVGGQTLGPNLMPRPMVDVWLDGTRRGTMKDQENVIELDNVSPGPHKLALVAKNKSNEIIDRKEINFTSSGSVVEGANSGGTTPPQASAYAQEGGSNGSNSYSSNSSNTTTTGTDTSLAGPTSSTSGSTYSSPQTMSSNTTTTAQNRTRPSMPATASNDGALLLAGGALLLGSYLIRRKA